MKVKEYIKTLPEKWVVESRYAFKIFKDSKPFDRWLIKPNDGRSEYKTVDEFVSDKGFEKIMNLEISEEEGGISNHGHCDSAEYEKVYIHAV